MGIGGQVALRYMCTHISQTQDRIPLSHFILSDRCFSFWSSLVGYHLASICYCLKWIRFVLCEIVTFRAPVTMKTTAITRSHYQCCCRVDAFGSALCDSALLSLSGALAWVFFLGESLFGNTLLLSRCFPLMCYIFQRGRWRFWLSHSSAVNDTDVLLRTINCVVASLCLHVQQKSGRMRGGCCCKVFRHKTDSVALGHTRV